MTKAIYSKDHKFVVEQLKKARIEASLDQEKAAELLKKTQSYISKVESGQRRIDIVQLKEFAKIYKKEVNFFIKNNFIMDKILTKKEAIKFLGLDDKTFDNYFQNADEFNCLARQNGRGRFRFEQKVLQKWLDDFKWRTVELNFKDYALCLDFALAQHFRGYVLSDWGTARQREFGQKITNWVKGQLAEVAVKKFFKKEFNVDVELDFRIYDEIVPQDIIGVVENGKTRQPKIGIGIKSSKPKSAFLVLGENEITIKERRSDYYIFCRPDMPDDHLLRLTKERVIEVVKNQQHFPKYKDEMPDFQNIFCEIAGWCKIDELEKVTSIPGQEFTGVRYVKKSGCLHKEKADWQELLKKL